MIETAEMRVLVVGEHKQGKSTLVNALCNAPISPVGAAAATAIPVSIRHGDHFKATVMWADGATDELDPERLAEVVLEDGIDSDAGHVMVEVRVPRRLVASSLCLIDTPPTAGESGIGSLVALELADSSDLMLFVSDATQELTAPELALLSEARERRARIAVVVARSDLSTDPDRIVEINRAHLRGAGMAHIQILAVSAHLHLAALAEDDSVLETMSGFEPLYSLIASSRRSVVEFAAKAAGAELAGVVAQIELGSAARHVKHVAPAPVIADATRRLDGRNAPWRMDLNKGVARLRGHSADSRNRRRIAIVRSYKDALESETSRTAGEIESKDFFEFLYREIHSAFAAHQGWLHDELAKLDADIRTDFELTVDACVLDVLGELPSGASGTPVQFAGSAGIDRPPMLAALQGWSTAAVLTSTTGAGAAATGLIGAAFAPFVAAPIALVLGPRFVREARKRRQLSQKAALREQAVEVIATSWQELEERERRVLEQVEDQLIDHYQRQGGAVAESLSQAGAVPSSSGLSQSNDAAAADGAPVEGLAVALSAVRISLGSSAAGLEPMAI